ncbi:hypothetical protein AB6859_15865 [Rahnella inusitata]|uniref:hypothetical protein n=1 Tax=Rahnella inusitata TaxID=58169 RepID=UPI0039BE3E3C
MSGTISIEIPSLWVYPEQFAALENMSKHTVYKWKEAGKLKIIPKKIAKGKTKPGGKIQIKYYDYKLQQLKAMGCCDVAINVVGWEKFAAKCEA